MITIVVVILIIVIIVDAREFPDDYDELTMAELEAYAKRFHTGSGVGEMKWEEVPPVPHRLISNGKVRKIEEKKMIKKIV